MAQHLGAMQQASLEVAAPLDDPAFVPAQPVTNIAQSLSQALVAVTNAQAITGPAPPTGVTAISYTRDTAMISWNDPIGDAVLQRRTPETAWTTVQDITGGTTSCTDSGLQYGQAYLYRVGGRVGDLLGPFCDPVLLHAGADGEDYNEYLDGAKSAHEEKEEAEGN